TRRQLDQARQDAEREARDCAVAYADLPEPYRGRVAPAAPDDWRTTSHPTPADLDDLRRRAARFEPARQQLRQARELHVRWTGLRGQVETLRQGVRALAAELPGDPQQLRQDHVRREAEEQAAAGQLKAARAEAKTVQEELDRLAQQREGVQRELSHCAGQLQSEA